MKIQAEFSLDGFERMDNGEAGAVFVKYERNGDPSIYEMEKFFSHRDREYYEIALSPRRAMACAIIQRSSRNYYRAMAYAGNRIRTFKEPSIVSLQKALRRFFEEANNV